MWPVSCSFSLDSESCTIFKSLTFYCRHFVPSSFWSSSFAWYLIVDLSFSVHTDVYERMYCVQHKIQVAVWALAVWAVAVWALAVWAVAVWAVAVWAVAVWAVAVCGIPVGQGLLSHSLIQERVDRFWGGYTPTLQLLFTASYALMVDQWWASYF
jgi:hypothetical protein